MKFKWERFKCWKCGKPYDRGLVDDLPPETTRAIMKGTRRQRYLKFCEKCKESAADPKEQAIKMASNSRRGAMYRRHLQMVNWTCQICAVRNKETVSVVCTRPDREGRFLQRDVLALCDACHGMVKHRIGTYATTNT